MAPMLVNVKLIVGTDVEPPGLTRLQAAAPPHINGRTLLGLPVEATTTVAALKKQVAALDGGAVPQWLRKGGGGGKGVILADTATMAECGITESMGLWEHLWVDSEANQALYAQEYEKVLSYIVTQVDVLDSKKNAL